MKSHRWLGGVLAGLGLSLTAMTGCQTWVPSTGQTLPSPRYLQHPPQYLPPSPPFPLSRELASQERAFAATPEPGAPPAVPLPPAIGPGAAGVAPLAPPGDR